MTQWKDQKLENEEIELARGESYHLGPKLEVVKCTITIAADADDLTFEDVRFVDCTIKAKREVAGVYWVDAFVSGCRFSGKFGDCDFGHWPSHFDPNGGIEDSDFSEASLDGCRFIDCDASTLTFPSWPCFTILDPVVRLDELRAPKWPGDADILVDNIADFPEETVAVTYSAEAIEKELDAPRDELKAVLEKLGQVRL